MQTCVVSVVDKQIHLIKHTLCVLWIILQRLNTRQAVWFFLAEK